VKVLITDRHSSVSLISTECGPIVTVHWFPHITVCWFFPTDSGGRQRLLFIVLVTVGRAANSVLLAGEGASEWGVVSREVDRGQEVSSSCGVGIERRGRGGRS
jgi:hypothetical protein